MSTDEQPTDQSPIELDPDDPDSTDTVHPTVDEILHEDETPTQYRIVAFLITGFILLTILALVFYSLGQLF